MKAEATPSGFERRRENRTIISAEPNVFNRHTHQSLGRLVNISREGFLVVADTALAEGAMHEVRIVVVDAHGQLVTVRATAELVWCRPSNSGGGYGAGFRFTEVSPAELAVVDYLIQSE